MANIELDTLVKRLRDLVESATSGSAQLKKAIGKLVIDTVQKRTKDGFGVSKNKSKQQLKPLSTKTVKTREYLRTKGKLSSETSPNKSNLVQSGDMINDLTFTVGTDSVTVELNSEDSKFKAKNQKDREFMNLTKEEEQAITNLVAGSIVSALKKF